MKIFSDDIITPDKQMTAITTAFENQNTFFVNEIEKRLSKIKKWLIVLTIVSLLNGAFGILSLLY